MSEPDDLTRLRTVLAMAREFGATEVHLGDVHVKLGPAPTKPAPALSEVERETVRAISEEDSLVEAEKAREAAHYKEWGRITRSSGAAIPPYVPAKASQ